jgi:hypothetical protein
LANFRFLEVSIIMPLQCALPRNISANIQFIIKDNSLEMPSKVTGSSVLTRLGKISSRYGCNEYNFDVCKLMIIN